MISCVHTGIIEVSIMRGTRGNLLTYSPDLKLLARVQEVGVVDIINVETKQKFDLTPCGKL